MLMIWLLKAAAYDASVAIDPAYHKENVSHLLKWKAIQHMQEKKVVVYELGQAAFAATHLWQPTPKNYGISFFKDGWARGNQRRIHVAECFFNVDHLRAYWNERLGALSAHQELG
jgi:hypothetical protein